MPMQGKMSREELDQMYGAFFGKAETLLTEKGKMILCSDEKNLVKKQIRLHKAFCLLAEYDLDGKGTRGLFVIGKKVEKGHRA